MNKTIYKYKLTNVDCAVCASKIEQELLKNKNIKKVNVDIMNSILEVDSDNFNEIKDIITRTEPAAKLDVLQSDKLPSPKDINKELIQLIVSIIIGVIALLFSFTESLSAYSYYIYLIAYFVSGYKVLLKAFTNIIHGKFFDEHFLMSFATLGAIALGEIHEAFAVMLFYNLGEYLQNRSVKKSKNQIKSLLQLKPDYANLLISNEIKKINPEEVRIDDLIVIKPGERIPLDGEILEGESYVDTYAITGESVPRKLSKGSKAISGMINKTGLLTLKVNKIFSESTIARILNLVENASKNKAEPEKFITTFAKYYTPVVVFIAMGIAFIPPLYFNQDLADWIHRALVVLVISCPCALVISIPLGYFAGIGKASKNGILVKGSNYLDALTKADTIIFDKTGTLTKGVFQVSEIKTFNGLTKNDILYYAAHGEMHSNHPIASAIIASFGNNLSQDKVKSYLEIPGKGIKAIIDGKEILLGNDQLLHDEQIEHEDCINEGTIINIVVDKKYSGYLIISDEIRQDSEIVINYLRENGFKTIMLTGDTKFSAESVAKKLKIDEFYSDLLPEDKVKIFNQIKQNRNKIIFAGDGINDAPVIAAADIGIAMGGLGSDAAIEASDLVIMEDDLNKIPLAIKISKQTRKVIWQNIIFAFGIKAVFIFLGTMGIASMWEAVFADMGVAILAIFNSIRGIGKVL